MSTVLLKVRISDLVIGLDLPGPAWVESLMPRFGKFVVETDEAPVATCVFTLDHDLSKQHGERDQSVEERSGGLHLILDNFEATLSEAGDARLTVVQAGLDPVDITYVMVMDSLLRMMVVQLLAARGGLMMHAAGIAVSKDAGYVFFGPSGSGKTTVCRLSHPRYRILCDELIAIRPDGAGYRLYGTPFNGEWGDSLAEDVPLRELFFLRQAPHNERHALDDVTAMRLLLESAVIYQREASAVDRTFDLALALIRRVPVTRLDFVAKETLWETVLAPTPRA